MAEKEDREDGAEDEDDAAQAIEAAARKKKIIMLAVIGVVLLALAGGGTWFGLRMLGGDKSAPAEEAAHAEEPAKEGEHGQEGEAKKAFYEALDPAFLANYTVGGRQHYLQVSLAVLTREEEALTALKTHMPLVRNRIVLLLSGEVFEQLQSDEGRVQLQQKLLAAIQEILQKETGKPGIDQVFFTGFVMQ